MAITTNINNDAAFPNRTAIASGEVVPTALIMTATTIMGQVEGDSPTARIAYVSVDPEAGITPEGEEITASDPTVSQLIIGTQKVSDLTILSNEAARNENARPIFLESLMRSIVAKADRLFLGAPAGDGNTPNKIVGLTNYTGIIDGGNMGTKLDAIIDGIATISGNGGTPTAILMGYDAWAYILKLTGSDKRPLISPDVANSPQPTLFGLPIVLNGRMPANTIIIIDKNELVSAVGPVYAASSEDRYFDRDSMAIRATFRFGYGILHPNRIAKITTAA